MVTVSRWYAILGPYVGAWSTLAFFDFVILLVWILFLAAFHFLTTTAPAGVR